MHVPLWQQIAAGVIFLAAYVAIATEKIDKVKVALVGAMLMVGLGIVNQHDAFGGHEVRATAVEHFAQEYTQEGGGESAAPAAEDVEAAADTLAHAGLSDVPGIDWNTIFLLIGMMIFVGLTAQTGVFEWLAIQCAKRAKGEPFVVLIMLSLITALLSAGLDNVTTVLLIAPVTLLVADALGISPIPLLLAEALASNIGGTATLVGDPPNILIASKAGFTFNAFLVHLAPVVAVIMAGYCLYAWVFWRKGLTADAGAKAAVMELDASKAIRDRRLLLKCAVVGAAILTGFVLHSQLGLEPATIALSGAAVLLLVSGLSPHKAFAAVEWETIFFFVGLFIIVGGLVKSGLISMASAWLLATFGGNTQGLTYVMLWFSAIASAVVDNIPYVATMCPLVNDLAVGVTGLPPAQAAHDPAIMPIWWALSLGACLGGNGTLVGASANVVVCGIARRQGHEITFWRFTKTGLPVMLWTVALCMGYLWLRYLR